MKLLLSLSLFLSSLLAQASYYQNYCSNSSGSFQTANGHSENYIKVKDSYFSSGSEHSEFTSYKHNEIKMETIKSTLLEDISERRCSPGSSGGMASWKKVEAKKVIITKTDGTKFPQNTIGMSQDGLSITTTILCTNKGNSRTSCNK